MHIAVALEHSRAKALIISLPLCYECIDHGCELKISFVGNIPPVSDEHSKGNVIGIKRSEERF